MQQKSTKYQHSNNSSDSKSSSRFISDIGNSSLTTISERINQKLTFSSSSISDSLQQENFDFLSGITATKFVEEFSLFIENLSQSEKSNLVNSLIFTLMDEEETFVGMYNPNHEKGDILYWLLKSSGVEIKNLPYFKSNGRNFFHYAAESSRLELLNFLADYAYTRKEVQQMLIQQDNFGNTPLTLAVECYLYDIFNYNYAIFKFFADKIENSPFPTNQEILNFQRDLIFSSLSSFDNQMAYEICLDQDAVLYSFFKL